MKARWVGVTLVSAAVVACGQGRAIFNIDVYSFLKNTGADTVHYTAPPALTDSLSNTPISVRSLALPTSVVESVSVSGAADLLNNSGAGTITLEMFLAADSASTYTTVPAVTASGSAGPGPTPGTLTFNAPIVDSTTKALFAASTVWVGVRVRVQNSSASLLDGKMQLTALHATVVIQDKLF
ncbi:MAG TPA: hypothetical protein VEU73_11340 [Gemmatimonadales bacterium]|nr:hypothetical protein [Gemmatimonadales bacterium]